MAIERKTVTRSEQHPFDTMEPAPKQATMGPTSAPPAGPAPSTSDDDTSAILTRTFRISEDLDKRLLSASLSAGMKRGRSVTKSDLVREALNSYLPSIEG